MVAPPGVDAAAAAVVAVRRLPPEAAAARAVGEAADGDRHAVDQGEGRVVLGILGIFFPFLWLIGAILPAKRGSRFDLAQGMAAQAQMDRMTS